MMETIMKDQLRTINWIITHLGKNPRKGGRPPNESKDVNSKNFMILFSLFIRKVWFTNEICEGIMIEITVKVKIE